MTEYNALDALLGRSTVRRRILSLVIAESDVRRHLREIARRAGTSAGTASRELQRLEAAGLVDRTREGRRVYYQASTGSPMIEPLGELLRRGRVGGAPWTRADPVGLEIARRLAAELPAVYGERLRAVYLYGSRARGDHHRDSDVDIVIVLDQIGDYGEDLRRSSDIASDLSLEHDLAVSRMLVSEGSWATEDRPVIRSAVADAILV